MCLDHRQSERRRCQHASDHVRTPLRKAKKISCVENTVARRQGINQYHSQGDVTQSTPTLPQPPFTRKYKKEGGRPESSSKQTPAWRGREKTSTLTIIKRLGGVGWGSSPVNQVAPSGGLVGGAVATTHLRRTPKAYNDDEWNQHGSWTCVCVYQCVRGSKKKRGADGSSPHITHVHTETHTRGREGRASGLELPLVQSFVSPQCASPSIASSPSITFLILLLLQDQSSYYWFYTTDQATFDST